MNNKLTVTQMLDNEIIEQTDYVDIMAYTKNHMGYSLGRMIAEKYGTTKKGKQHTCLDIEVYVFSKEELDEYVAEQFLKLWENLPHSGMTVVRKPR
jgi:hypothetical protein